MTSLETLYQHYLSHPIVSTDSRNIPEGCIFFALCGEHFDGNDYALEALQKGASYAVVDNPDLPEDERLLLVDDSLLALQELAALHRAKLSKPVIAITGTNGKTTTKELCAAVLSTSYKVLYTEGNLNNHIGVPLTLLRLREEHDFALIEMGANKPGDIAELCEIAQPNYGIITNIGEAHLAGFKSIIGVERTKAELYEWLRQHDGKAIRKEEDERLIRLSQGIPSVSYGQSQEATIRATRSQSNSSLYLHFTWEAPAIKVAKQEQTTQLVGDYNLDNALAAIALGLFFGVDVKQIKQALSAYQPNNHRSQYIQTAHNELIVDAYNANPSSMRVALENFVALPTDKAKLLILGDMNELGERAEEAHRSIYDLVAPLIQGGSMQALFCGPQWTQFLAKEQVQCFPDIEALSTYLNTHRPEQKLILIKGSNSIKLSSLSSQL